MTFGYEVTKVVRFRKDRNRTIGLDMDHFQQVFICRMIRRKFGKFGHPPVTLIYPTIVVQMMKTIKFRIEPNSEQRRIIDQMIDANRIVYNSMITACKIQYTKTKELPSVFDMNKMGTRMRHNSSYIAKAYSLTLNETAGRVIKACERTLGTHKKESGEFDIDTFSFILPEHHFPRDRSYGQFFLPFFSVTME